jgi:hypothetical protein
MVAFFVEYRHLLPSSPILLSGRLHGIHYLEHSTLCDCDGIDRRNARSSPVIKGMKEEDVERV